MKNRGHGIQLQVSDMAATPAFTTVAQVENVQPPGWERETEDVPTHDDPAGSGVERIAHALYSGTPVTLAALYDPAIVTHQTIEGLKSATDPHDWKVIYPDAGATQIDFSAWCTTWQPQGIDAKSGLMRVAITLTPTGDV